MWSCRKITSFAVLFLNCGASAKAQEFCASDFYDHLILDKTISWKLQDEFHISDGEGAIIKTFSSYANFVDLSHKIEINSCSSFACKMNTFWYKNANFMVGTSYIDWGGSAYKSDERTIQFIRPTLESCEVYHAGGAEFLSDITLAKEYFLGSEKFFFDQYGMIID